MFMGCILSKTQKSIQDILCKTHFPFKYASEPPNKEFHPNESVDCFIFQIASRLLVQEYETILYLTDKHNQTVS